MFRKSQDVQISFDDRMLNASDQTKRAVDDSRAKLVGDIIYPNIDEDRFAALFSKNGSRPNIEIRKYVSFLVLERMYKMSEANALEFLRCGALNFQYAIHTTQDEKQPLSESSLRRFRRAIEQYNKEHKTDLLKAEFERISAVLGVEMGILPGASDEDGKETILVRMDSMMIEAHAKVMTRLEILYMTIVVAIRYLLRNDLEYLIPDALSHYLEKGDHNNVLYYRAAEKDKKEIQTSRINTVVQEMILLYDQLHLNFMPQFIMSVPELAIFDRVYGEQVIQDENGVRIPRNKHDISANSIQNPFDETVTYRNKRGPHHGSVLNVAEAHDGKGNGIIIQAELAKNTVSDNELEKAFLEQLPADGPAIELQTDGGYGSSDLEKLEKEKNVNRKSTSLTGKRVDPVFADFKIDDDGKAVDSCPKGYTPTSCTYNENTGKITAVMPNNCCANCANRDKCNAKVNNKKSKSSVQVKPETVNRAKHAKALNTKEYKKAANDRNASEGIMSVLRRKYDIDHIPVFGIERASTWVWCSLLSYNAVKFQRYQRWSEENQQQAA